MSTDLDEARHFLAAIGGDVDPAHTVTFVYEGNPARKERPRHTKSGVTYTPKETRAAEDALSWAYVAAFAQQKVKRFGDTVAMFVHFYVEEALDARKDIDNLLKLVLDAGNAARIWKDDKYVIATTVLLDVDERRPRTVIGICPKVGSLTRSPLLAAK